MKTHVNKIAFILAIAVVGLTGINAKVNSKIFIPEQEEELKIETWMTEDGYWQKNQTDAIPEFAPEADSELAIESWMCDENFWK
ncbi:hypothetical protein [Gaoshiqia sp. Z1-71]|uniref:hypothetical protein n=1 Tax=Gaoshiqia hydrogeniformans TaxID=3290090 RepID=UPI003BF8FE2F